MRLPTYRQYKDSGVEWLGTIPTHWHVDRFKASIISCRNGIWGSEATGDTNDIACVRVADFDRTTLAVKSEIPTVRNVSQSERAERLLTRGNLLLEKSGGGENQPVGQVVIYSLDIPAVCSNFVAKMELAPGMFPAYWNYVHAAAYSVRLNVGSINQTSGIQNLDQARYFDERAPFPPIDEQEVIAAFLDHETGKIDALIAEQEKLLELLAEKRQATISHAVTRGLNPDVPMKNSGVEWFEAVPEHWTVCTLRRVVLKIEQGWSPECDNRPADDGEWGVLKTGCVNGGVFNAAENKALPDALEPAPALEIRDGDLLMSRASGSPKLVGSAAYITNPPPRLILSDKIFRLHLRDWVVPRFLAATFTSAVLRSQIEKSISGAEGLANNLPQSNLKGFWIVVPPRKEQEEIVAFVDTETAKLDALKTDAERAIDLLKERRKALISAAVTGKIDVREHPSALAEAA
ncbi:restriction endonuclease subunit S [Burkholderia multivorans]|uniref:restriction endonuclease subunit S n=1 Tax=Burkholderia multivorans TaxID=87883 RepID=UPI000D00FB94|nr:restriction endonuclease subunit S [Burkholderia multivorans]MBY4793919.1 restriction endonuclease subunit S [Burkholderia multivorans]PRE69790.1 restriction endonuclease subunit S [Burkholderia multivorans]PRE83464.1 restriction endonuclease subunit S [Burkholderia multivorans]PRG21129.1 restriction endonuclease subunit S [Burkholderia multivorans]